MLLPKVSFIPALLAVLASPRASAHSSATSPRRITYGSLLGLADDAPQLPLLKLTDGLVQDGVVSVTDIPSFRETKRAVMSHLHACIMDAGDDVVPTQRFPDGTVRRSLATSTSPAAGGPQPLKTLDEFEALAGRSQSDSCARFRERLSAFRSAVDVATGRFAERLSAEMGESLPKPLLSSRAAGSEHGDYQDIKEVVAGGEHLEHFHSYQKSGVAGEETIEFHTDQGFFIAFTPGMIVSSDPSSKDPVELSDGFYVQDSNGEKVLMEFTGEDDLVFMMGDGVNQFINNKLVDGHKGLRATPHALTVPFQEDASKARVWYGRMVLPPGNALVPSKSSTFSEARQILVDSISKGQGMPLGVGCSSPTMTAFIDTSRRLDGEAEEAKCPEDQLFCWYRCMSLADHEIESPTACAERNLGMQCASPRLQVIPDGLKHGDYYPQCTNHTHLTHPYTPYPEIPQQKDICAEDWAEFSAKGDYEHLISVTVPEKLARERAVIVDTKLAWSVVDGADGKKKVKARLAYNNPFGWLAFGFADPEGKHNGMNGGNIILAMPGGNYSPVTGIDFEAPASTGTYKIHDTGSSFRHWQDPIVTEETNTTVSDFEVDDDGCFTALTFESDHINGQKFNVEGTDEVIWAGNHLDHYMGHHGYGGRSRFTINWATGDMTFWTPPVAPDDSDVATSDAEVHSDGKGAYEDGHEDGRQHGDEAEVESENSGLAKNGLLGLAASFGFAAVMHYL